MHEFFAFVMAYCVIDGDEGLRFQARGILWLHLYFI